MFGVLIPRLENMRLTSAYLSGQTSIWKASSAAVNPLVIDLPTADESKSVESPPPAGTAQPVYINPLDTKVEIFDPLRPESNIPVETPGTVESAIEKRAHRLLVIKKRKMKVHRRRRLWKRMWTVWKKKFYGRERRKEIDFRNKLIAAVKEAQKFDVETYTEAYIKDYHYEFVPLTYKGRRKHRSTILELLERDKQVAKRNMLNKTNMVTGQPLILDGETVDDFAKRNSK